MSRSVPPPPGKMSEARARFWLGRDLGLWRRCGEVATTHAIEFSFVWNTVLDLREAGHQLREAHIVREAKRREAAAAAFQKEQARARERARAARRRDDGNDAT
jgi:hypothetical protein